MAEDWLGSLQVFGDHAVSSKIGGVRTKDHRTAFVVTQVRRLISEPARNTHAEADTVVRSHALGRVEMSMREFCHRMESTMPEALGHAFLGAPDQKPVIFTDFLGRQLSIPYEFCDTETVRNPCNQSRHRLTSGIRDSTKCSKSIPRADQAGYMCDTGNMHCTPTRISPRAIRPGMCMPNLAASYTWSYYLYLNTLRIRGAFSAEAVFGDPGTWNLFRPYLCCGFKF